MRVFAMFTFLLGALLAAAATGGATCVDAGLGLEAGGNAAPKVMSSLNVSNKTVESAANGLTSWLNKLYIRQAAPTVTETHVITATVTFTLAESGAPCATVTVTTVPTVNTVGTSETVVPSTISAPGTETGAQSLPSTLVTAPNPSTTTATVSISVTTSSGSTETASVPPSSISIPETTSGSSSSVVTETGTTPVVTTTRATTTPAHPTSAAGTSSVQVAKGMLVAVAIIMLAVV